MTTATKNAVTHDLPDVGTRFVLEQDWVEVYACSELPSRFGDFHLLICRSSFDDKEQIAMVRGTVSAGIAIPARIHSECLTGDVLGSLRCDCRDQLENALVTLGRAETGVLLYLRQEGRGIGLGNKVRAYALQEQGMDTFEANEHLGFDADLRHYRLAAMIFQMLGVHTIHLATNNPHKISELRSNGIEVQKRLPLVTASNPHNEAYLRTKARSGHLLPQ